MEEKHLTFMANKQTRDISLAIFFCCNFRVCSWNLGLDIFQLVLTELCSK
jgi:hypothetical protein